MKNKTYLITGGTGSLGKRLTLYIQNNLNPKKIKILSRDEQKQFSMSIDEQFDYNKVDFSLGDIRNLKRCRYCGPHSSSKTCTFWRKKS